jgi:ADP-ribose pyrophosphatase YjhB (NUDIX family)
MMSPTASSLCAAHLRRSSMVQRLFSTNASYFERKKAAKQERIQTYEDRMQKGVERKHRRDSAPKDVRKQEFRTWWDQRRIYEEGLDRKARQAGKDWKIEVAVVLERLPVVMADIPEWEKDFDELQAYLRQFGKLYPKELVPERTVPTIMTDEELLAQLPPSFRPAPRETEADQSGKVNTMDRKLKDRVFLLLEEESDKWAFPKSPVVDGESLLDAAKRTVNEQVGKDLDLYYPSNGPCAIQVVAQDEGDYFGRKIFYVRVQHDEGDVSNTIKHGWLDRQEIVERMLKAHEEDESKFYQYLL